MYPDSGPKYFNTGSEGHYDQDFLHTVRGMPYQDVRNAIDLTFREHTTTTLKDLELDQTAVGNVPNAHCAIVSARCDALPVRRKRDRHPFDGLVTSTWSLSAGQSDALPEQ